MKLWPSKTKNYMDEIKRIEQVAEVIEANLAQQPPAIPQDKAHRLLEAADEFSRAFANWRIENGKPFVEPLERQLNEAIADIRGE